MLFVLPESVAKWILIEAEIYLSSYPQGEKKECFHFYQHSFHVFITWGHIYKGINVTLLVVDYPQSPKTHEP